MNSGSLRNTRVGACQQKVSRATLQLAPLEKWRACAWSVVQLNCDEELKPLCGMYGSMEAEFRAELTAFLCLLMKEVIGMNGLTSIVVSQGS